ncbi:long-chain fatty acid--CoA ligase [Mycobacterium sp. 1245499.0]|uniref:long-chain-fatty acid--ACP ligase MbtM n=1 Tax=unclassified Mycobacterium TaxID=2642494 RepID=UPI0007FF8F02|nr:MULTISPECIES: long-chain-fatty acid--ACP ligase MbtM [unclassified Mycobacterium]OBJ20779.1 long-chain fatty acid--CoA ligase [Mycobacterium sp. 1245801.1]OBK97803.1 long-chain fatty acid--CoA ligase [Mycobacterium sp. 1245499.0]
MNVLAAAMREAMTRSPHDLVVLDKAADQWTAYPWPEVHGMAERIATRLLQQDHVGAVGLVGEPTVELVAAIQGAWLAGAAVSILPRPRRGADPSDWAHSTLARFSGVGVSMVLSHGSTLRLLGDAESALTVCDLREAARAQTSNSPHGQAESNHAILQGTAGSTGDPRTAVLSPAAVLHNMRGIADRLQLDGSSDRGCSWLPIYHDMGLAFLLSCALSGMPLWQAPTGAFSAAPLRWAEWLSASAATFTAGPNFGYATLGRFSGRVSDVDLGPLRIAVNGGEPVDCAGFDQFATAMAPFGFRASAATPAYGMAESTCAVTMPEPATGLRIDERTESGTRQKYALLGRPIPGMELRIRPAENTPDDRIGEVEIRGTSMMDGYFGDAGSAAGLDTQWFRTGDIGYLVDGELTICGRSKEVITIAGRNIFPTEIEQVAGQVEGVRQGAVVAVGSGSGAAQSRLLIAAEFLGSDHDVTRSAVIKRVISVCGVTPADVVLMPPGSLPRTSSGKLRRLEVGRQLAT